MTPAELLAREILRLDSRGGCDTTKDPDYDPDAWPAEPVVRVALLVLAQHAEVEKRWTRGRAA